MNVDTRYQEILSRCLCGDKVRTRNADCRRVIFAQAHFTAAPLVTVRRTAWKTALREMEGFLRGDNHLSSFHESVRPWWEKQCADGGYMPNSYGEQFRDFAGNANVLFDQIEYLIDGVTKHPFSRRNVITTWNTADMASPETIVTTCHGTVIQAFVDTENRLHVVTYQRSADVVVGLPHNWIQYWAFLMWLAHRTGRVVGSLLWLGGDVHLYEAHTDLARRIVTATRQHDAPELSYAATSPHLRADDFTLSGPYTPTLTDRAEMVV